MDKRTFIKIGTTLGVGAAFGGLTFTAGCASPENNKEENGDIQTYPFELPALAYAFDALEPHIDAATMEIHHGRHHQGYVNNLNAALENGSHAKSSLENILSGIGENDTALRNNGGGHYNHKLFWEIIGPQAGGEPDGNLREAINSTFGNLNTMKDAFEKAALGVFGSGWAWLVADSNNKLQIVQSPNQDNPLMYGIYPGEKVNILMGIDVWEHAYYLHYQNRRADYVKAFWNIVRWDMVAERLG